MTIIEQTNERITFLRKADTDVLLSLLGEILHPEKMGMSVNFFRIGMDPRFRQTQPVALFEMIASVLKERIK